MQCPDCQSNDVYSCRTAYERGTRRGSYSGYGDAGSHSGTTFSQTPLARKAGPPQPGLLVAPQLLFLTAVLVYAKKITKVTWFDQYGELILGGIILVSGGLFVVSVLNLPNYYRQLNIWKQSWICGRCGQIFIRN